MASELIELYDQLDEDDGNPNSNEDVWDYGDKLSKDLINAIL